MFTICIFGFKVTKMYDKLDALYYDKFIFFLKILKILFAHA